MTDLQAPEANRAPAERIAMLEQSIESLNQQLQSARASLARSAADFEAVADRIKTEAEERDWCSEYDDIVRSVNLQLQMHELYTRAKEYEVSYTITATITSKQDPDDEISGNDWVNVIESLICDTIDVEEISVDWS